MRHAGLREAAEAVAIGAQAEAAAARWRPRATRVDEPGFHAPRGESASASAAAVDAAWRGRVRSSRKGRRASGRRVLTPLSDGRDQHARRRPRRALCRL